MKNSNIQWIGAIPDSWQLNKIGQLFNLRNEKVSDKDFAPLSVSRDGVVPQMESVAKSDASDDRKLVLIGDFAINSRSDRKQSCGVSPLNGSVSLINLILYAKDSNVIYNDYMNYLLKNYGFAEEFYKWGHGIVADLWTTRWQEMKNIMLPLPSLEMQKKIFDFLNKKILEVNNLIEIENKQIEKLQEYKQAVITEAVTKGLDKSAPMKDSGVEWIGEIPENWSVKKAKFIADSFEKGSGITKEDIVTDGDTPCVRYGEIYTKYNNGFSKCVTRTHLENVSTPVYFEFGDILFVGTGELVEEIGKNIVYLGTEKCLAGGDIIIMKHNQEARFLNYAMNCIRSQMQKSYGKAKLKVVHISAYNIGNIYIALPNKVVQTEIADYLDKKCSEIDALAKIKQKKIDMLNEYKKSLIYEYVTGKKEVV